MGEIIAGLPSAGPVEWAFSVDAFLGVPWGGWEAIEPSSWEFDVAANPPGNT